MICIAPAEKDTVTGMLEERPWDAADQFRANSGLKPQEYSRPRYAMGVMAGVSPNMLCTVMVK